jgi:hypothetical protein
MIIMVIIMDRRQYRNVQRIRAVAIAMTVAPVAARKLKRTPKRTSSIFSRIYIEPKGGSNASFYVLLTLLCYTLSTKYRHGNIPKAV